jgi:hypothetical protein
MFATIVMWLIVVWAVAGCWLIVASVVRRADDIR